MTLVVTGNSITGNIEIEAEIASDDFYDVMFTNNRVEGNVILKTREITKDVLINECNFDTELKHMSPEVWFMYHNIFIDKKNPITIIDNYALGKVDGLRFNLPFKPKPLMSEYTYGVVIRCIEFLKKYHNP